MQVLTAEFGKKDAPEILCQSLMHTGFGVLSHHPISKELIKNAYQQWADFFRSEDKHHYQFNRETQDGYFPFRTENAKNSKISDLKEFYHFYPHGRIPENLRDITFSLFNQLQELGLVILKWIESHLPKEIAEQLSIPLNQMPQDSTNTLLRILHYPPLEFDEDADAVRAAAHEDINLITLLPAATSPGLEVLDKNEQWHAIDCDPGNIVINIGDMLQKCTQHYFKSTTHRVVNPKNKKENCSRYSMPLFLHGRKEVKISPNQTAQEYLMERLREIGIY